MISAAQQSLSQGAIPPAALSSDISTAVAAKALNAQRQQGDAIVKLLDSAGSDGEMGPGDALVAKATGLGGLLDITA
jgi:hypothetical protein